jgi:glycosyltransferase involved in cell wall biosynthesis
MHRPFRIRGRSSESCHVCFVTETYPPEVNGVALTLRRLIDGLRQQDYTVSLVRPRRKSLDGSDDRSRPSVALVPALPLPGYKGLHAGLPAFRALKRYWAQRRPDVVYVATEGPLGWSAVRTALRLNIPVLSGFHTNFHSYSKHYHAGWLQDAIFRYLCRFHNSTSGTLVPSAELRDLLQARGIRNISVLDRGVDSRLFAPARRSAALRHLWSAGEDDLVALYVGRIAPEKNLEVAIQAYRAMQAIDRRVKFVIVGDGPQRAALQKMHPDLLFCGEQRSRRLAQYYASADVFLFPSETETFGNVILEAMASGLVIVAYDYAAARVHIRNGDTGMLAPYSASRAFIDAAGQIAAKSIALTDMKRRAREHALSLDWQRVVDRFAALLSEARKRHPAVDSDAAFTLRDARRHSIPAHS